MHAYTYINNNVVYYQAHDMLVPSLDVDKKSKFRYDQLWYKNTYAILTETCSYY